jgi:hypothetical protein
MDTSAQRARFATRFAVRRMPPADLGTTPLAVLGGLVPVHTRAFPMRR